VSNGFFIVHRELFEKLWFRQLGPKAIGVLHLIARAQWGEGTLKNGRKLGRGQCVVGRKEFSDATGLSEKEVRTLFTVLQNVDFAAIEGANEGTVITLKNYDYYQDIRNFITPPGASEGPAKGPERGQPGASEGPLIKEDNTKKEDNKKVRFSPDDFKAAEYLIGLILKLYPDHKTPNLETWAKEIRLIRERDGKTHKEICELFKWANSHPFWQSNILSPSKLREQWDRLQIQRSKGVPGKNDIQDDSSRLRTLDDVGAA
jgi:hypothetical protein